MSVQSLCAVALGGAFGSVLRYVLGFAFAQQFGPGFPWGTMFINVTGSFVIGLVWQFSLASSIEMPPFMRVLLMAGVLGGYTTFSTFSLEATSLISEGALGLAAMYVLGSVGAGLAATFLGMMLARALSH